MSITGDQLVPSDEAPIPIDAATVVVMRDASHAAVSDISDADSDTSRGGGRGPEVLMLRRNSRGAFGGMWVFPGGQVDPADRDNADAHDMVGDCEPPHGPAEPTDNAYRGFRTAAVREAAEEAGIDLSGSELVHLSHWLPPPIKPKRFATHFFVCEAPADLGKISIDRSEILDHIWITPAEALRRRAAAEIKFVTPTFVTLTYLVGFDSTRAALNSMTRPRCYHTEVLSGPPDDPGLVAVYPGDAAYPTGDLDTVGPRRRCYMLESAWSWEERD